MKKTFLISTFVLIGIVGMSQSIDGGYAQNYNSLEAYEISEKALDKNNKYLGALSSVGCVADDCLKSPIPSHCITFCRTLKVIFTNATVPELKVIGGYDSQTRDNILLLRNSIHSHVEPTKALYMELTSKEWGSFINNFGSTNSGKLEYWTLPEKDRRKIYIPLERVLSEMERKRNEKQLIGPPK